MVLYGAGVSFQLPGSPAAGTAETPTVQQTLHAPAKTPGEGPEQPSRPLASSVSRIVLPTRHRPSTSIATAICRGSSHSTCVSMPGAHPSKPNRSILQQHQRIICCLACSEPRTRQLGHMATSDWAGACGGLTCPLQPPGITLACCQPQ